MASVPSHYSRDRWERVVYSDTCDIPAKEAVHFLNYALGNGNDLAALEKAEEMMASHVAAGRELKSHHYRNLGIARNRLMLHSKHNTAEMLARTKAAFVRYLELADAIGEHVLEREAIEQTIAYDPNDRRQ